MLLQGWVGRGEAKSSMLEQRCVFYGLQLAATAPRFQHHHSIAQVLPSPASPLACQPWANLYAALIQIFAHILASKAYDLTAISLRRSLCLTGLCLHQFLRYQSLIFALSDLRYHISLSR